MNRFIRRNWSLIVALAVAGILISAGAAASHYNPIRQWQINTYYDRLEAHAEAEAAYVKVKVDGLIADAKGFHAHEFGDSSSHYARCVRDSADTENSKCVINVASNIIHGYWFYHAFGVSLKSGISDSDLTAEQRAAILDWTKVEAAIRANPESYAHELIKYREEFERPIGNEHAYTTTDRRHPTFPLRSEYPYFDTLVISKDSLTMTSDNRAVIELSLNAKPETEIIVNISWDGAAFARQAALAWQVDEWATKKAIIVQAGRVTESSTGNIYLKAYPRSQVNDTNLIYSVTIPVTVNPFVQE